MAKRKVIKIAQAIISVLWIVGLVGVIVTESGLSAGEGPGLVYFLYGIFSVFIVGPIVLILHYVSRRLATQEGMAPQSSGAMKVLKWITFGLLGLFALWIIGGMVLNTMISLTR